MGSSLVLNNLMHLQLNTTQTQPVCHDGREALRKPDSNAGSSTLTRPPTPRLFASILSICSVLPQTCYQQEQVYRTGHLGFGGARLFQGVVEKAEMGAVFPTYGVHSIFVRGDAQTFFAQAQMSAIF